MLLTKRMMRLSLVDATTSESVTRVQAIVEELGAGNTPHQDLMESLRELLHERCTLAEKSIT